MKGSKLAVLLFLVSLFISQDLRAQQTILSEVELEFNQLRWLTGRWEQVGREDSQTVTEQWELVSDSVYDGKGVQIQQSDTVSVEHLAIIIKDETIYYVADVPENPKPVFFELVEAGNNYFTAQNPDHDFPTKITYRLIDGVMRVVASNEEKTVEYRFRRRVDGGRE